MTTPPGAGQARSEPLGSEPASGRARSAQVRRLFSEIAPRYDLLNHVLSLNIDRRWRRRAVDELDPGGRSGAAYLDLCTGTFDLALEMLGRPGFAGPVVGADFADPMLARGLPKIAAAAVRPVCGDAERLPFATASFAGAIVGFGVRNLANVDAGFAEVNRVLRPGGRFVILEFTVPPNRAMRRAYLLYFNHVLPLIGRVVSGHPWAYTYLPKSVKGFPGPDRLAEMMRSARFEKVRWFSLSGGIAAIHVGEKAGAEG